MQLAMDKILYYNNKPLQGSPSAVIYLLVEVQYRTMYLLLLVWQFRY